MHVNHLTEIIIGSCIAVHRKLGPGLLESAYEVCLCYELSRKQIKFERQKEMPIDYGEVKLDCGYRIDLLVENKVVVELKAVDELTPVHQAQILTYMRLSGCKLGLLVNFNVVLLKNGIKRMKL